jgi:hypothetical protein
VSKGVELRDKAGQGTYKQSIWRALQFSQASLAGRKMHSAWFVVSILWCDQLGGGLPRIGHRPNRLLPPPGPW